jgi:hypothetical protein
MGALEQQGTMSDFRRKLKESTARDTADVRDINQWLPFDHNSAAHTDAVIKIDNQILGYFERGEGDKIPTALIQKALALHKRSRREDTRDHDDAQEQVVKDGRDMAKEEAMIQAIKALKKENIPPELRALLEAKLKTEGTLHDNEEVDQGKETGYVRSDNTDLDNNARVIRALLDPKYRGDLEPALRASLASQAQQGISWRQDFNDELKYKKDDLDDLAINRQIELWLSANPYPKPPQRPH